MQSSIGIGEALRRAREARRLSLVDVERETKIRRGYLGALEEERFDALPGRVYAKGYVRAYAHLLGLDTDALLEVFERQVPAPENEEVRPRLELAPGGPAPVRARSRRYLIAGVVVVGLASLGYWGMAERAPPQLTLKPAPTSAAAPPPPAAAVTPPAVAPTPPAPASAPTASGSPAPGVTLALSATGTSWLRVMADGERVFEGFVQEGEAQRWSAERELWIRVGNASAIELLVNGEAVGPLGGPGAVVTRTFSAAFGQP